MAEAREFVARRAITKLRLVAEREQRFLAAGVAAGARDRQHLVARQERRLAGARRMSKGAVMAHVPAKLGQRNENLAGIGNNRAMGAVAAAACGAQQRLEIAQIGEREGFLARQVSVVGKIARAARRSSANEPEMASAAR